MSNSIAAPAATRLSELASPINSRAAKQLVAGPREKELIKECREFEGILIANLWTEMEKGVNLGDPVDDPGFGTMQGFGIQAAALGIADAGGLGLARMLYHEVAMRVTNSAGPQRTLRRGGNEGTTLEPKTESR
ncbi:MAG TPA: rod-binding protein [Terriglobia bacterium]|nr:rod-binding protein [Terriglobia bacterium]